MDMLITDISRRDFLRGLSTAGLVAGFGLRPQHVFGESRKLGVALLGLGRYSTNQLGPALRETKLCYLAVIFPGLPERGGKWFPAYGLRKKIFYSYDNLDKMAANKEI